MLSIWCSRVIVAVIDLGDLEGMDMAKIVKKTYGKKFAWETGSSHAFDEAKLQSRSSPSKIIRPSIWAKVPLVEAFTAESPPRLKKRVTPTPKQDSSEGENAEYNPKKGRKRKIQDPFGFGDIDDEVLPASEYISPKRKRSLEKPSGMKKSKAKKLKLKGNPEPLGTSFIDNGGMNGISKQKWQHTKGKTPTVAVSNASSIAEVARAMKRLPDTPSPKKRGRPPKHSIGSGMNPPKGNLVSIKAKGITASPSPKKRGRPPKHSMESVTSPLKVNLVSTKAKGITVSPSPKKRGRPPKHSIGSVTSPLKVNLVSTKAKGITASPSPKKRGRPPKHSIGSVTSPLKVNLVSTKAKGITPSPNPKKRGRPPKNSLGSIMSPPAGSISPKKAKEMMAHPSTEKRGKSPKSALQSPKKQVKETAKVVTQSEKVASPKKRGRPPKNSTPSHVNQLKKISNHVTPDGTVVQRKKRGRPPKSQSSVSPVALTSPSINEDNSEVSPKKRGRPPKSKSTSPEAAKDGESFSPQKSGRPPKASMPVSPYSISSSQASSQNISSVVTSAAPSPKRRGRPPKNSGQRNPTAVSSSNILETHTQLQQKISVRESSALVPKRRGRPPKSSSSVDTDASNQEKEKVLLSPDIEACGSEITEDSLHESDVIQERDSVASSKSVMQVINEAPLIENKHGRKAKIVETFEVDRPMLSQDIAHSTDTPCPSSSQMSSQPGSSTESTVLDRIEMDQSSSTDQVASEEYSMKIGSSADTAHAYDNSETSPIKASTSMVSGSPFKWFLKNNEKTLSPRKVAQFRRMSVLPTCTPQKSEDDDENDGDLGAIPFSLSWAMQQDDNAVRVSKDDKELFTIVRNTKQAQESVEFGESQQFKDDVEYLLDGISDTNSLSTRCLSLIELASKCSKSAFRMNLRAHGTINAIFQRLSDAPVYQTLALCTASVMFMLTRDRLSIDFDKSILEIMLKLLAMEDKNDEMDSKEWDRLTSKIRVIFEKHEIKGVNNLDLSKLTTESLAREALLSLTLQRTGSWFKDEIRLLGGLDHVVDTVVSCSKCLKVDGKTAASDSSTNIRQIERCLKLLENVTVQCQTNQGYLTSYRDSALLETCSRLLMFCVASLTGDDCDSKPAVQALWFSTMKTLLNLTHDNELASTRFCQKSNVLSVLLKSALQLPSVLPSPKQFDVVVLSLGLLINLVEYSKKNLLALNAAIAPPLLSEEYTACSEKEDTSSLESLLHLFMIKLEAAKDNSGMDEDLAKLNTSLHNSSIRIGSDGVSLVCGDDLEKSANEESPSANNKSEEEGNTEEQKAGEQEAGDNDTEEKADKKASSEKQVQHLGKALEKAGQHMEDSLIASYAALLVGLLCEENKENQQIVHEKLQYGDFGIMTHTLDKFLAFMNMTASSSSSSSSVVIKRAIGVLEQCKSAFPANLPLSQMTSS